MRPIVRRGRLNVSQIFEDGAEGHYRFWGGFNWPAIACVFLGQLLHVWLLDPVTLTARGPVRMLTASGPAVLLPMLLYYVLVKAFVAPAGKGGYGADTAALPIRAPNL